MISVVVLTYNRLHLLHTCLSAIKNTIGPTDHEIFVINNASIDGTKEWLDSKPFGVIPLHMKENIGVIARNEAFRKAQGDIIFQIDDDVIVNPWWSSRCGAQFETEPSLGMIGQQGGLIKKWMDVWSDTHRSRDSYVDYLTGFFLAFRNVGIYYDEYFGTFWHEELDLSLQFKFAGYRLKVLPELCVHHSHRNTPVDWDLHNRNVEYCNQKWKDKIQQLDLEGLK